MTTQRHDGRRPDQLRVEDRPVRLLEEVRLEVELAQLVGQAPVVPLGAHWPTSVGQ